MRSRVVNPLGSILFLLVLFGASGGALATPDVVAPPFLEITIPVANGLNPALRPPIATYSWQTILGEPDPAEVRWIMLNTSGFGGSWTAAEDYIRNNPGAPEWSAWQSYSPPGTGTSWTSPAVAYGEHVFAVQGRDGGTTLYEFTHDRNLRRVRVSARSTGPLMTVTGNIIDPIITSSPVTPPVIANVMAGTEIIFCWTADASIYGGVVDTYRFGWDILDLEDPEGWDIASTPYPGTEVCTPPRTFFFGTHTFTVETVDNDGYPTRAFININVHQIVPVDVLTWGALKLKFR